ncbi:hypothetical protein HPP92_009851 [Vanilla planifolia]|uniref:Tf2-1-like SH3-like domain-containing protein n=1 Tax=Vanilla planifolia TaxID=51239 RepID=A0A835REN9_VANPL|nr:hypothetical protein HPP92_009851 [Vanilla planifolia]
MKGVFRFGKTGKLKPKFIGPFQISERIGQVAYRIALPIQLAGVHDVFHVSLLRKYVSDPAHIIRYDTEGIEIQPDLTYQEKPILILDRKEKVLRNKAIPMVRVLWQNHTDIEATWEIETDIKAQYPDLF